MHRKYIMKKIFIGIALLCLFAFLPSACVLDGTNNNSAYAATQNVYGRIIDDTTPFYSDYEGKNLLFYLPYTYYVKILEEGDTLSHVEYGGNHLPALDGYVPTEMLFKDDLPVSQPCPEINVTTFDTASFYANCNRLDIMQYIFANRTATFYGSIILKDNTRLVYVQYNGKLGYISENSLLPFSVPQHPNELTFIKKDTQSTETIAPVKKEDYATLTGLRIIIVGCLMLAGIIALFVAKKNKPHRHHNNYYDENDYE